MYRTWRIGFIVTLVLAAWAGVRAGQERFRTPDESGDGDESACSAVNGGTAVARRAGTQHARSMAASSISEVVANTAGSSVRTP